VKSEHSLNLCSAIMNMSHLVSLSISASNQDKVLPVEALHLPATLTKLFLSGQLEKRRMPHILSSWSHLSSLTQLSLGLPKLDEEPFSSLVVLNGLCCLQLGEAYDGKKLFFPAHSLWRKVHWQALLSHVLQNAHN
jgi:disease resistance protein RPM1